MLQRDNLRNLITSIMTDDNFNIAHSTEQFKKIMIEYGNLCGRVGVKTGTFMEDSDRYLNIFLNQKSEQIIEVSPQTPFLKDDYFTPGY